MKKKIKPILKLVAIEQTEYLFDEDKKQIGRLYEICLVDETLHTHICSFTPSLWLAHVGFFTTKEIDDDVYDDLRSSYEYGDYYDLSVLRGHTVDVTEYHDPPNYDDETYDEWFENIVDYYRCNFADAEHEFMSLWSDTNNRLREYNL